MTTATSLINRPIVQVGAVIGDCPFAGKWAPAVRYEGDEFAQRLAQRFDSFHQALEFAQAFAHTHKEVASAPGL